VCVCEVIFKIPVIHFLPSTLEPSALEGIGMWGVLRGIKRIFEVVDCNRGHRKTIKQNWQDGNRKYRLENTGRSEYN